MKFKPESFIKLFMVITGIVFAQICLSGTTNAVENSTAESVDETPGLTADDQTEINSTTRSIIDKDNKVKEAWSLYHSGKIWEASRNFNELVADNPNDGLSHFGLARIALDTKRFEQVLTHSEVPLKQYTSKDATFFRSQILANRAQALFGLGRFTDALADIDEALELNSSDVYKADKLLIESKLDNLELEPVSSTVFFLHEINSESATKLVKSLLAELDLGSKEIILVINSAGGSVSTSQGLYSYINTMPVPVTTINLSNVQSGANLIFCAGDRRLAMEDSFFMFHDFSRSVNGRVDQTDILSDFLAPLATQLKIGYDIVVECSNLSEEEVKNIFRNGKIYTSTEAEAAGIVTEIVKELPKTTRSTVVE